MGLEENFLSCSVRTAREDRVGSKTFDEVFGTLLAQGISPDELFDSVCKQVSHMQILHHHCISDKPI